MADKYSFIVIRYPDRDTAEAALGVVRGLAKEKVIKLKDAVTITKTEKGKLKLHQTKDDPAGKGLLKGSVIGLAFAVLFGGAGWIAAGALSGTAFAMFDRGIKNKLLKELGEEMRPDQSALALLIEEADWAAVEERTAVYGRPGEIVVALLASEHMEELEQIIVDHKVVEAIPEEVELVPDSEEAAVSSSEADRPQV